jgi:Abnormal spindle-like microcephaly-assoc'd, ASPM-SPD-2-Hydin
VQITKKTLTASILTMFLLAAVSPARTKASVNSCVLSGGSWMNVPVQQQTGGLRLTYTASASAVNVDSVTGLSFGPANEFSDLAAVIRFNSNGAIDAMNGSAYTAIQTIRYSSGVNYHFTMYVNLSSHTYTAYVMIGKTIKTIGSNLAFRTAQSHVGTLNNVAAMTAPGTTNVCNITVVWSPSPLAITTQPTSRAVAAGQIASFSIATTGTAPLTYQWMKNGAAISGANSSNYSTPVTTISDNGTRFTASVSNSTRTVTSNIATLTVTSKVAAPSISAQPVGRTVTAGQASSFSVTASGTATLTYQWMKNGAAISGANAASYITPATKTTDSGSQFAVTVRNSSGSVTSSSAMLTVTAAAVAPSISTQPVSRTVTTGQTSSFSVTASGTATLTYQWMKNGAAISGANAASYITPATKTTDTGSQFAVTVRNSSGSVTSSSAMLTVTAAAVAPSISTQPVGRTVTAGQTSSFSVTASGTATLTYQWMKNGAAISGANAASYTSPATKTTDSGSQFSVIVTNGSGSVSSSSATLTVTAAAALLLNSSSSALSFGNVNVSSSGTQNVTLTNAGNSNVTISQVLVAGAGFNSSNASGIILSPGQTTTLTSTFAPSASGSATGKVTVSSNATNSPASISLSGTGVTAATHSVQLSWSSGVSGVTGFNTYSSTLSGGPYVKKGSTASSDPSYTDTSVQTGRTYYYVVTAVNSSNQESGYSSEVTAIVP